jgi:hypothetical protein
MKPQQNSEILQHLNPADYFTLAMDDEIRRENMPGSLCGFALQLDKQPDITQLSTRIDEFTSRFPLALSRLQQLGKQFYWCKRQKPEPVFFQHRCPESESDDHFQRYTINNLVNRQEPREVIAPIEFHLISGRKTHCFLLRWIHPFCDARGIELIMKYLCTDDKAQRELFDTPKMEALINSQLEKFRWWQKIYLFLKANRYINELDRYQSILHGQFLQAPQRLNAITQTFNEQETALIAQQARQHCGLTGTSLYYIGCLMRALQQLEPDQPGEAYCVPYAFNLRKQKALSPVLGNHIGALFAQAPKHLVENRELLFSHLKQQNAQVMRQQLDYAFLPVMWAASWLSLKKHGTELRKSYKNGSERSSFWFSDIGQIYFEPNSFFNSDITGVFHFTQISSPPGLALLCCLYRKQLTVSYSFNEPLFSESWIAQLHDKMAQELLGQTP